MPITIAEVQRALPTTLKSAATQQLVDKLNVIGSDQEMTENIRDNFIGYVGILKDGKFKVEEYLNAVAYVSFKIMGYTNGEAYEKTFPDRMARHIMQGTSKKDLSAYVAGYARGKLVNLIFEQSMVPTWVLNQDAFQQAINTQVDLMRNSASDLVRTQAANSVLTHLKKPEIKDFQISIDTKENSGMRELQDTLRKLATEQLGAIASGIPTALIAAQPIIEAEFKEVDPDQTEPG